MSHHLLRELPSVGAVLEDPRLAPHVRGRARGWMTRVVQEVVDGERARLRRAGDAATGSRETLHEGIVALVLARRAELLGPTLTRVINATGVVVHTNLGRSLHPDLAVEWARLAARHNVDLEFVLETGRRGHRGRRIEAKAALLAGAEDALIVNNNAAAVWLAARYLTRRPGAGMRGGRLVLSRGEVVAIGGSFRMHDILAETGCELAEVGTTNRTSLADYREALVPGAVVMKVHRSNFYQAGFTESVPLAELAGLCHERGHPLLYDAGSGALFPFAELGLDEEPTLDTDLEAGADVVTCSGDKLLGGCQAGIILGRADLIDGMRRHPMRRAFRVDKTTLAAMDAVLSLYLAAEDRPDIPTVTILGRGQDELEGAARALLADLAPDAPAGWEGDVVAGESSVGGGSFSASSLPTRLLLWRGPKDQLEACHAALRRLDPAVVSRMNQDGLAFDLRTVLEDEPPLIAAALRQVWRERGLGG